MANFFSSLASSRKNLFIIIFALIAIIVGAVLVVIQVNNLRELNSQIAEEELALEQAQAQLARRIGYRENAPEYREMIRQFRALIPEEPEEDSIFRYFGHLAGEYELRLVNLNFEERDPNPEQNYIAMPLAITMEGNYSSLISFLNHLYGGPRAIRVDNVSISPTGETPANISISITAFAFYSPDDL